MSTTDAEQRDEEERDFGNQFARKLGGEVSGLKARPSTDLAISKIAIVFGLLLFISGVLHLSWLFLSGGNWEGPLSLRKPGLFGVSGGLTVWSIAWVMTKLNPHRYDRSMTNLMSVGLFLEVALITLQQWRGVASHFNHATFVDATIEASNLGLILFVTMGIIWLTLRSSRLPVMSRSSAIAIRGGLWLLTISCVLGFLATFLGELNVARGRPPEIWGPAGILKYPHGAALHAIQLLPAVSWLMHRLRARNPTTAVVSVLASQAFFLLHACWQTIQGRSRLDLDWLGGGLLVVAGLFLLQPTFAILSAMTFATIRPSNGKLS
jgi:hypothetical protein